MKIKKILLENIRSHPKSEVYLNKGITIFTGRTGSGKSSFLMALEYSLFGSEAGLNNNAILKRNKQKGRVVLEFEEAGHNYTIIRGLKRSGKNINVDIDNMAVLMDEKPLPLLGRATDLNQKILEVLNYPTDIKPKELFEVTSYTKQDEIRALIEMGAEKRQGYIDKILQLAKYRQTWENLKDVLNYFSQSLQVEKTKLDSMDKLKEEVIQLQKKSEETKEKLQANNLKLPELEKENTVLKRKNDELESEHKKLLELRREYDKINGTIQGLKSDIENSELQIGNLQKQKTELEKNVAGLKVKETLEELQLKYAGVVKSIEMFTKETDKLNSEFRQIKELGKGKCPTCKQKVTSEHIKSLDAEFKKSIAELNNKIVEMEKSREKIEPSIRNAKSAESFKNDLKRICENLEHYSAICKKYKEELETNLKKKTCLSLDSGQLDNFESALKKGRAKENGLASEIRAIMDVNLVLARAREESELELEKRKKELQKLEFGQQRLEKLKQTYDTLNRLREDIRNIREIVRRNFLEDFRREFQKKFEEIRRYEEEYVVDIKPDYEPVAYTRSGEEVPVSNLSGGEKTSVALAYRLALAALAAQVSSIRPSELLILDEPTTGFDQEDVKALPATLRNIQTIPQIIIVSHEEELKNAADYKFEVTKEKGESKVKEIS